MRSETPRSPVHLRNLQFLILSDILEYIGNPGNAYAGPAQIRDLNPGLLWHAHPRMSLDTSQHAHQGNMLGSHTNFPLDLNATPEIYASEHGLPSGLGTEQYFPTWEEIQVQSYAEDGGYYSGRQFFQNNSQ